MVSHCWEEKVSFIEIKYERRNNLLADAFLESLTIVLFFESLERGDIRNPFEILSKLFDDVCAQVSNLFGFNKFEQLNDGRVKEVVSSIVCLKRFNNRSKEVTSNDVSVVDFVLQSNYFSEESERTWTRKDG